jgi:hypothetical protein
MGYAQMATRSSFARSGPRSSASGPTRCLTASAVNGQRQDPVPVRAASGAAEIALGPEAGTLCYEEEITPGR